jgi:hypothetical protein
MVVVSDATPAAAFSGLEGRWVAVTLDGRRSWATARQTRRPPRETAFVVELDLELIDEEGSEDVPYGLVLPCWTLLGMLDRAIELTCVHVLGRKQFGQPLASFQGVQFQLAEAEVERSGLEVLANYSLWSLTVRPGDAFRDALAFRLAALEAADAVFRVAHQLHGAIGLCDEASLSWLSRYSQPLRQLPIGLSDVRDLLTRALGRRGLVGLFDASEGLDAWTAASNVSASSGSPMRIG